MWSFFFALLALLGMFSLTSVHQVHEGHVGVYYTGGALKPGITEPGFHFKLPDPLSTVSNIQITLQTDTVTDIPCGTSGGVMIYFDKIEVVNRLNKANVWKTVKQYGVGYDKTWIFDKIHHEINQFCSSHTLQEVYIEEFSTLDEALASALQQDCDKYETGIDIIAIRVTKPRIPNAVRVNYEKVEEQKTKLLLAIEAQKVTQKDEETRMLSAKIGAEREEQVSLINARKEASVQIIGAEKTANISRIMVQQQIEEKRGEKARALMDNDIYTEKRKAEAEAIRYAAEQEAIGNAKRLTPEYLRYVLYQAIANNSKIFWGDSIPTMFSGWGEDKHLETVNLSDYKKDA